MSGSGKSQKISIRATRVPYVCRHSLFVVQMKLNLMCLMWHKNLCRIILLAFHLYLHLYQIEGWKKMKPNEGTDRHAYTHAHTLTHWDISFIIVTQRKTLLIEKYLKRSSRKSNTHFEEFKLFSFKTTFFNVAIFFILLQQHSIFLKFRGFIEHAKGLLAIMDIKNRNS